MDRAILTRPEAKRAFVRKMFDGIAGTYDLLNHVLSLGVDIVWRRWTVDGLGPEPGWRILDLATGTGDLGFEAAGRSQEIEVVGADLSTQMLRRGVGKGRGRSDRMRFLCGDAETLPFPDEIFDGITIGFGIRNVANLEAGLHEIFRVLKPGGRLAVLEFSRPRAVVFRGFYYFYFRHILPLVGKVVSQDPDAYRYLYESVMLFPEGEAFCRCLQTAGFIETKTNRFSFGIATLYLASKSSVEVVC